MVMDGAQRRGCWRWPRRPPTNPRNRFWDFSPALFRGVVGLQESLRNRAPLPRRSTWRSSPGKSGFKASDKINDFRLLDDRGGRIFNHDRPARGQWRPNCIFPPSCQCVPGNVAMVATMRQGSQNPATSSNGWERNRDRHRA